MSHVMLKGPKGFSHSHTKRTMGVRGRTYPSYPRLKPSSPGRGASKTLSRDAHGLLLDLLA